MSELSKIKKAVDDKGCAWEALTKAYLEKSSLLRIGHEQISARYEELRQEKERLLHENGRIDAAADDVIEINAGGELIVVTRRTLTQIEGSLLEALFSGRWEKKLLRDEQGRVFLDVNSVSFRAIVDYLTELNISSPDSSVPFPLGDDDTRSSLDNIGTFFGLKSSKEKI
uniref:Potassium channel tetramerisation-type BTB domain-containing protein n=1 Tax=Pseudictyota dubia TaxID=2749911 RepID=A0A7R9VW80_9STRA|mmetsp:Transcript_24525/g.45369  ORF Transcript_24525/g.45369 Transcript_24525/m.45369 type:complete len:170 (+) Transcript_24525:213-722(+)